MNFLNKCILIVENNYFSFVKWKQFDHISDNELLDYYYADNNHEWIGILLQRYTMLLLGVCMKYVKNEEEAKDCVQQIFLKVLTEVSKYKIDYFKSWLYMVAKNHCLMKLRGAQQNRMFELTESTVVADNDDKKNEVVENERTFSLMEEAINELNNEQRQCVILFYLQKNSYSQISEKTGYNLLQVKSYIQNGKRNLRAIMEKKMKQKNEQ